MIVFAPAFLAGILLVQQFSKLPDPGWLILLGLCVGVLGWRRYWRALFFMLGIFWAMVFASFKLVDRLPEPLAGTDVAVKGVVADLPQVNGQQLRFDFIVTASAKPLPSKLRLSWYFPDRVVKAGQHWELTVKLKPPHGTLNPGGFDYEAWLFSEGIGATGYVRPYPKPVLSGRDSAWTSVAVWRQTISDRLSVVLADSKSLALIKALTIGEGSLITQQQWDVFRKTGTTHLVVISGSHIGLVAGLVYFLVLELWARTGYLAWSPQKAAALAALTGGVIYAGLAGFSVPTQRSVVMLAIAMLAIFRQHHAHPFNILAVALFAVLVFDPLAVLSPGFWLSFLAVAVIIYVVAGRLGKSSYFTEAIHINWVTSVGLSPLLLFFFQQISLISPPANFVAVPVISLLVVPAALLCTLLMFIWQPLAEQLFFVPDIILQGLYWILERMADLPLATLNHPQPSHWALLFAIPGILLLLAPRGMPARWLGLLMLLPLAGAAAKPSKGAFTMTLLDVGQGLSAVVQTENHWLVYDTGAKFSSESDMGRNVLLPFLRLQAVSKIDGLIISHGDNDHIGGTASLLREIPAAKVLTSVPQQLRDYAPVNCMAGQSWNWDEVKFTVLSPQEQPFASDNNNSCVLKIASEHGSVLLTGDIEVEAESRLLETYGGQLKADVLVAPHHGSKTSSSKSFLQAVNARTILIPAGYRNPFGHPHKKVLERYRQNNAKWLNTADSGAITIAVKDNAIAVQSRRETDARYWHQH